MNHARLRPTLALIFAALLAAPVLRAPAQVTNIWTNTVNGTWSDPNNWSNGAPASASSTIIRFDASGATSYVATNDFAGGLALNQLQLNSSSTGTQFLTGNAIQFTNNLLALPML